jgi:hypothetical protein
MLGGCGEDPVPANTSGQWLKGDLHLHSAHSTDALDNPEAVVIARAEHAGMDFFVFTDHDNHVQGNIETWADPAYHSDKMVLLYGVEWTTAHAHANLFGVAPWDHPPIYALRDGDAAAAIAEAHRQGLHFSVNHPVNSDGWEHAHDLDFDSVEVWNAVWLGPARNARAIRFWEDIIATGRRLPGRGGSDSHHQTDPEADILNVGNPTTHIFARQRSASALLEGMKAGHMSISYAPAAERLDFSADADGDGVFETMAGDSIAGGGKPIVFAMQIAGFRAGGNYTVNVFKNGEPLLARRADVSSLTFEDTPAAGERSWYRVELHGAVPDAPLGAELVYGEMIAMSNPVYVSFP